MSKKDLTVKIENALINHFFLKKSMRFGLETNPLPDLYMSFDIKLIDQRSIGGKVTYKF